MPFRADGFEPSAYAIPPPRPEQPRRARRGVVRYYGALIGRDPMLDAITLTHVPGHSRW